MTKALYFLQMDQMRCAANVMSASASPEVDHLILDQTVFYPQGGGQPSDTGIIEWEGGKMIVGKVFWEGDSILHRGEITGERPSPGTPVKCSIDEEKRRLHTRLHSAGHLIDMALAQMGSDLIPEKGHHFPDGPYVQYKGEISVEDREAFQKQLEEKIRELIAQNLKSEIHVDRAVESGKVPRKVYWGDYGMPCGGTHVASLGEIGAVIIRGIKNKKGSIKVKYGV